MIIVFLALNLLFSWTSQCVSGGVGWHGQPRGCMTETKFIIRTFTSSRLYHWQISTPNPHTKIHISTNFNIRNYCPNHSCQNPLCSLSEPLLDPLVFLHKIYCPTVICALTEWSCMCIHVRIPWVVCQSLVGILLYSHIRDNIPSWNAVICALTEWSCGIDW